MNGYMLVWILLQEIERLNEELKNTKTIKTKTDLSVQDRFPTCPVFLQKKRYVIPTSHIVTTCLATYNLLIMLL